MKCNSAYGVSVLSHVVFVENMIKMGNMKYKLKIANMCPDNLCFQEKVSKFWKGLLC